MSTTKRNPSDSAGKEFLRNNECFADICNLSFFAGKQIIQPENIHFYENDLSSLLEKGFTLQEIKRLRDLVRVVEINGKKVIIGIEHQSRVDKNMIYRTGIYDMLVYLTQAKSKQEVQGVVTAVLFTGGENWKETISLKEALPIPKEIEEHVNDWKIPIIDIKKIDLNLLKSEFCKEVVEIAQSMYEGSYERLRQNKRIRRRSFMLACIFTNTKIKEEDLPEGDEIKMCEAMDRLFNQFKEEGRNEGRNEGIKEGRKEERINTLQSTVRSLLNVKFGNISNRLDQQITNTSVEKLNQLTLNIFNVTSEEDVLRIIN